MAHHGSVARARGRAWLAASATAAVAGAWFWFMAPPGSSGVPSGLERVRGTETAESESDAVEYRESFGTSRALIIGISTYEHLKDLRNAQAMPSPWRTVSCRSRLIPGR